MIFRKFYNTDAAEAPAATEQQATPTIAELMATQGTVNNTNSMVATPVEIKSTEKPTETETPPPAARATEEVKVEEVKTETPPPAEVKVETPKPPIEEAKVPEPSWQEVAQKQPNEVLKALGYDELVINLLGEAKEADPKMVALLQAHKDGKLTEYLRELTTDYSKLSAEEVMRHQLRKDYPKASERQLDVLYNKEVVDLYNLDSTDTDLLEEGKLLLEAKADRYRDSLIENQQKYLVPKYEAKVVEPDKTVEIQEAQRIADTKQFNEMYKGSVDNSPLVKNIIANKFYPVGEGDKQYNFPVEKPDEVLELLFNTDKFNQNLWETQIDANGKVQKLLTPKTEHQILVATVMRYGKDFTNKLIEHGISLGSKAAIAPIVNAKEPEGNQSSAAESAPKTAAEAMAKSGKINSGGR